MTFRAKLTTLNVRGFGEGAKQKDIFDYCDGTRSDFTFLQETLASRDTVIADLRNTWPGKSFWSPALGKQGGVAVLVAEKTDFEIKQWKKDSSGRIISLLACLGSLRYNFINVYAPTNPRERKSFYETLHEYMFPGSVKIIAGDFNCFESERDKFGGNLTISSDLQDLRKSHRLLDVWRKTHDRQIQCTWFNAAKTIGSRLDKFFISQELFSNVKLCDIRPCIFSDHDSVDLELELQNVFSHGPGIWRLNLDLLDDENFCIMISGIISKHAQLRETFPSIHEWWDFLKDFVKYTAKKYGRDKQRKLNSEKVTATNRLINAKISLVNGNTSATKLIDELESQIKSINRTQNEGAKIRSRAKFFEEGEKPTRFFFSLESTRAAKNSIRSLYDLNGTEVNTQQEIEHAHWNFYSKLYSAEQIDPQIQNEFMSNVPVSLSDDEKSKCDLPLTLQEITLAIRSLSKGKTPGSNGLPLEFYIKFCDLLAPHLVDLFNFSLENGSFSLSMQESMTRVIFKKDDPKDLKNWRPISLLNVDYDVAKGTHFNIGQYADDSTFFVKDVSSLQKLFQLLRKYELGTGAKLNVNKTEAMWLGAWRTCTDTPLGLTWVNKMKILGVYFSNGLSTVEQENWQPKLSKLEKNLNRWKSRNLSLVGKALIVNTLGASKFWFLAKILPAPSG